MEKKEFREEFSQFMKQTGKSQKQVSKETGLSTSVISQFLDGKYTGDNGKVQDILNKFLSLKHTASWPPTMAEAVFMLQNWHHWSLRNVTAGSSEITKPGKRQRQNLRQGTA